MINPGDWSWLGDRLSRCSALLGLLFLCLLFSGILEQYVKTCLLRGHALQLKCLALFLKLGSTYHLALARFFMARARLKLALAGLLVGLCVCLQFFDLLFHYCYDWFRLCSHKFRASSSLTNQAHPQPATAAVERNPKESNEK